MFKILHTDDIKNRDNDDAVLIKINFFCIENRKAKTDMWTNHAHKKWLNLIENIVGKAILWK